MSNYIFVTGGVLSSLGKGIASASIATLIKHAGFSVSILKIDPYINVDPGNMSPLEHGEVFVTSDGAQTDLDVGHYERFLNMNFSRQNNFTTGQVYLSVINKERDGHYGGKTIQVIPHIVDEIKRRIIKTASNHDFLIVELGGTVGDIEGLPFLEAMRQIKHDFNNVLSIHVTLVPFIKSAGELKTKPTQHSVQELRRIGISPHLLLARSERPLSTELKEKLSFSCDVKNDCVISVVDARSIYEVPLNLLNEGILNPISRFFNINPPINPNMKEWEHLVNNITSNNLRKITIALITKYNNLQESYKSLNEALEHAKAHLNISLNIKVIDAKNFNEHELNHVNGILISGNFDDKEDMRGKLKATRFARLNNISFLGINLGMQVALIDYIKEIYNVNINVHHLNHFCMGEKDIILNDQTHIQTIYKNTIIKERYRQFTAININDINNILKDNDSLQISSINEDKINAIELKNHKFFIGVQFQPEFNSRLQRANPIILSFLQSCI